MTTPTEGQPDEVFAGLLAEYDQRYACAITALRAEAAGVVAEYGLTTEACVVLTRAVAIGAEDAGELGVYALATVVAHLLIGEIENASSGPEQPPAPTRPWRVGRHVGRTIYMPLGDGDELLVGLMDTPELAQTVIDAVNRAMCEGAGSLAAGVGATPVPAEKCYGPPRDGIDETESEDR